MQQLRWGQFEYANLRYENITLGKWGLWTGDYLHPTAPEVCSTGGSAVGLVALCLAWGGNLSCCYMAYRCGDDTS